MENNSSSASGAGNGAEHASADPATLGYEAARDELAEVVRRLEAGGLSLEDSLTLWERGEQLAETCQRHLTGARARIESVIAAREQHADAHPLTN